MRSTHPATLCPLTFPQQAVFLDSLLGGAATKSHTGGAISIRGPLDTGLFRRALACALSRHDALRVRLHVDGECAMQEFVAETEGRFEFLDFSGRLEPFQAAIEWILEDIDRPMDLKAFPLTGDVLFRLGGGLHLWYPKFHHIVNDPFGQSLVAGAIATAYNGLLSGGALPRSETFSYAAFIRDDREYATSERFRQDEEFWRGKFARMPEPLPFTARKGHLRGDILTTERSTLAVQRLVYRGVLRVCEEAGVTPLQFFHAALCTYLHRVTGRDDIVIGTPILNRGNGAFHRTAGMFQNMMPLRLSVARNGTILGLARQVRDETRACSRHQRFPLAEIVRHCRNLDGFHQGVFDVTVSHRKLDYGIDFGGSPACTIALDIGARPESLSLEMAEYGDGQDLNLFLNYHPQLISSAEIRHMAKALEALLVDTALAGDRPIREVRLMAEPGSKVAIEREVASETTVLDAFQRRAAAAPGATAIVDGAGRIPYGALEDATDRVAAFLLRDCHVTSEQPVAVLCGRGAPWVAALLGVMKAGGAYLPLDPEVPREQLEFVLKDSGCRWLVAEDPQACGEFEGVEIVPLADALGAGSGARSDRPVILGPRSLAYIIYTSGTTGPPKGVLVEHGGLANTALEQARAWNVKAADRVLGFAGPMFDASLAEVFLTLVSGATLVIAPKEVILEPPRFVELLARQRVTVAILPPGYLNALSREPLPSLRLLGTAGEAANPADVAHYNRSLEYVNAYGAAENSICSTFLRLDARSGFNGERVPIGKPLPRTEVYILDENLEPMPDGAAGEICVAGINVARGYLNRPDLMKERFLRNPFREGERMYRTGDLGRVLPDGNLEYLGRRDTEVKIRGYRVELGEVETILKTHPAIETAAAAAGPDGELVAYVVPRGKFLPEELRRFMASRQPAYMVPSRWVRMAGLPLSSSGKLDRAALPALERQETRPETGQPPATSMERAVARIWEEVLGSGPVSRTADFFELGGHSLNAVSVLSRIQRRLGVRLQAKEFFEAATIARLAALIEPRKRAQEGIIPPAPPAPLDHLSPAQTRIWVHSRMEGGAAAYNLPVAFHVDGDLDAGVLERAFESVIARHDSLRTCFVCFEGAPRQKVVSPRDIRFRLMNEDLSGFPSPEETAHNRLRHEITRAFDLGSAPLLRAGIARLAPRRHLLYVMVHQLVCDGWSAGVLLAEVARAYENLLGQPDSRPAVLPFEYRDYCRWMSQRLENDELREAREYWLATLAGPLPELSLPSDRPRPAQMGFEGTQERFPLLLASAARVPAFCAAHGISPFMFLLAGVSGLLHRYTGDEDIIIATPAAGRNRLDLEEQIGSYGNTLPIRVRVDGEATAEDLLSRVRTAVLEAEEHGEYPFDRLIEDLKLKRRTDRNPVFDVMLSMRDTGPADFQTQGLEISEHAISNDVSIFDLTFHFSRNGAEVLLDLEYNTGLFERPRMERLAGHLDRLLAAIVSNPTRRLADLDILPEDERRRVVKEFAQGPVVPAPEMTVIDLFAQQASRNPGRTAVLYKDRRLRYGELAAAASRIVSAVRGRVEIGPGSVVALVAGRSEWVVPGIVGIMASGAACLPIDSGLPAERIRYLLDDSGAAAVVSDGVMRDAHGLPMIALRESQSGAAPPFAGHARLEDVAYLAYTSGSTGSPKGALIEHNSLASLVSGLGQVLYDGLPRPATELLLASIGFDVALKQIFGALTRGNALVVAPATVQHEPQALIASVLKQRIHLIDLTPQHFEALLAQGFARLPKPDLKAIVLGSEAVPAGLVEAFLKEGANRHIAIHNFYGPSECTVETVSCSLNQMELGEGRITPIGRPLPNTRAYILSPGLEPVGIGMPGEICLGGTPVGRGYWNRPELTAGKFVPDPFRAGERIYRTGDIGRWTSAGMLEFVGRADDQLQIRGYRVEPSEIEQQLLRHPGVTGAVAAGRAGNAGDVRLVAWYTAATPATDPETLRAHLRRLLPDYMVPARLVAVDRFPVGANGKVDRDALPDPWSTAELETRPAPDRDALETEIAVMWQQVLGIDAAGTQSNFFDVGGDSLLLVRLHALIDERHSGVIKLTELFSAATVHEQAALIRQRSTAAALISLDRALATGQRLQHLGGSGQRKLFCFAAGTGSCDCYGELVPHLRSWSAWGVDFLDYLHPASVMADLLVNAQPEGNLALLGYASGGNLAYDVVLELENRGRRVSGLVLIDTWRRLEPFRCGDGERRRKAEALLAAADPLYARSPDREFLLHRVESYGRYLDSRAETRRVACPIHLIHTASQDSGMPFRTTQEGWGELASGFAMTAGSGGLGELLKEPHVTANAVLIEAALEACAPASALTREVVPGGLRRG